MRTTQFLCGASAAALLLSLWSTSVLAQQALPTIEVGKPRQVASKNKGSEAKHPVGSARGGGKSRAASTGAAPGTGGGAGQGGGAAAGPYGGAGPAQDPYNKSYTLQNASTGTKTDTPVMDTPLNVQSVSQQVLQDQQAITLGQALQNVSGASVSSGAASGILSGLVSNGILLRGFQTTNYFRDGFRVDSSGGPGADQRQFANVAAVEVLKGPGAILYGFSDPGGIVNIVTKQPLDTPYYAVNTQIGSLADYRTSIDATGPLNADKSLLYRINMSYENNGAPYGSIVDRTGTQTIFVAPVFKWNIDAATWVKLEAEYSQQHALSDYFPWDPLVNGALVNMPRNVNFGVNSPNTNDNLFTALTWSHEFDKDWSIKQQIAFYDTLYFTNGIFTSVPYFIAATPFPTVSSGSLGWQFRTSTYSTNVDITGHINTFGAEHTLLLGGDYYRTTSFQQEIADGSGYVGLFNPSFSTNILKCPCYPIANGATQTSAGLYLQDQIKLPYDFFLMTGARYQFIRQDNVSGSAPYALTPSIPLTAAQALTPRFGLLWQPQKWLSLYGNYAEGFGPNAAGQLVWPGSLLPPTSAKSWEAGAKLEFFDGKLRISADYFELVKTNVPYQDPNPTHICAGAPCSLVAGAARSTGPEIDVQGEILPGWSVIANYTNDDVRFTKLNAAATPVAGPGVGERFPGVPRNQANLFTTYEFQNDSVLRGWKFGAGYHYFGSMPVGDGLNPPWAWQLVPSYGTVDLMAAYSFAYAGSKMTAQVNVTNLLDRTYYTGITGDNFLAPGVVGGFYRSYGAPFAVMGSIRAELDKGAAPPPWLLPIATASPSLPTFTWTGLYVGGQMGYGWGDNDGTVSWATGQGQIGQTNLTSGGQGVIGGAHVGYNQQFDQWVLGLEGSVDGTTLNKNIIVPGPNVIADPFGYLGIGGTVTGRVQTGVQGSVRARAGYAFGRLLPYATGGVAFGSFNSDAQLFGIDLDGVTQFAASGAKSATRVGWTLGGGVEYAINNHWSARAEYRYTDFGHLAISADPSAVDSAFSIDRHLDQHQVQVGFSYKLFADPEAAPAPLIMKGPALADNTRAKPTGAASAVPPPSLPFVMNWMGFYVGAQIGYGWGDNDGSITFATPGGLAGQSALNGNAVVIGGGSNLNGDAIGVIGGAHLGYNWQFDKWVVGLEGSVDPTLMSRGASINVPNLTVVDPNTGSNDVGVTATGAIWSRIQGSARARAGYALGRMLFYGTGGVAIGAFGSNLQLYGIDNGTFSPLYAADQRSATRLGWTVGGGVEYAVNPRWSVRGEYRYTDFGHLGDSPAPTSMGVFYAADRHLDQQQVQVGVSYHFNGGVTAPVEATTIAANLPSIKGPASPPLPPPSWTGLYSGVNVGGGWSINNNNSTNFLPFTDPAFPFGSSQLLNSGGFLPNLVYLPGDNGYTNKTDGVVGGGQLGYNFQLSPSIVIGAEADIQGTTIVSGHNGNYLTVLGSPFVGGSVLLPLGGGAPVGNVGVPWFGTARARAGWLLNPSLLLYGTGGLAYGGLDVAGFSTTAAGWTVGTGGEWMFAPNWSAKLEYLYMNPTGSANSVSAGFPSGSSGKLSPAINVVRGGVNYHFNWAAPAPVLAKY